MSEKLTRKKQLIFAKDTPDVLGNGTSVFGSVAQGNVQFSKDVDVLQSNRWQQGLAASTIEKTGGSGVPVMEDFNTIWYTLSRNLAYLYQQGLAEWDANQTYFTGNFVAKNSIMYISLTDNNINHDPANDTTNWRDYLSVVNTNITNLQTNVANLQTNKQDKLTAGDNITIDSNNKISASGGVSVDYSSLATDFTEISFIANQQNGTNPATYTVSKDGLLFFDTIDLMSYRYMSSGSTTITRTYSVTASLSGQSYTLANFSETFVHSSSTSSGKTTKNIRKLFEVKANDTITIQVTNFIAEYGAIRANFNISYK